MDDATCSLVFSKLQKQDEHGQDRPTGSFDPRTNGLPIRGRLLLPGFPFYTWILFHAQDEEKFMDDIFFT